MNIFCVDHDPIIAANSLCDKHVVKMVLETAQMLSSAIRITSGIEYGYKITHRNHPCSIWTRTSKGNFDWLKIHGIALCEEYTYRYHKIHKSSSIIINASNETIPNGSLTAFAQAMPEQFRDPDPVKAYRNYYRNEKIDLLVYTNRSPPTWLADIAKRK